MLPRPQLPDTPIVIPGPGPQEPHARQDPTPPVPPSKSPPEPRDATDIDDHEEGESDHDDHPSPSRPGDPYSSLGDAFKDYLTDRPQPIVTTNRQRHGEEDLLF
jgi:hypothetical protein